MRGGSQVFLDISAPLATELCIVGNSSLFEAALLRVGK